MHPRDATTRTGTLVALVSAVGLLTASCTEGDGGAPRQATTVTATETVTTTETVSPTATPGGTTGRGQQMRGELLGTAWVVEVIEDGDRLCLEARASGETDRLCGDPVELDPREDQEAAPEQISAVQLRVANLSITAGFVVEPVARVRIESEAPPEDPGGGAVELLGPVDALVGFNAYANADEAGGPLDIERVVALDATGDEIASVEPEATSSPD